MDTHAHTRAYDIYSSPYSFLSAVTSAESRVKTSADARLQSLLQQTRFFFPHNNNSMQLGSSVLAGAQLDAPGHELCCRFEREDLR